jgi:predicted transglutaminase-like cysteine proteinase
MARGRWLFAVVTAAVVYFPAGRGEAATLALKAPLPQAFAPVATTLDRAPEAWPDYCTRHGDDCRIDLGQPLTLNLTPARFDALKSINLAINRVVLPMTDMDHWGVEDHWDQAEDGYGDCEDYQLLKRKLLVEAGFPRRAMLMTVVHDEDDNGHAVLMIRSSIGDLILDNRTDDILSWRETGYRFVQRESQYVAGWVDIENLPDTNTVAAGRPETALSETTAAASSGGDDSGPVGLKDSDGGDD